MISSFKKESKPPKKNIVFNYFDKTYTLVSYEDEILSSIFEKFKEKSGTEKLNLYFICNGEKLDPKLRLNQIKINNNNKIYKFIVHKEGNITGGNFSMLFTDISKQIYEEHYFSDKAPSYRIVCQGINIYGICKVKKCLANKKEVVVPLRKIKKFNLIQQKEDLECPECGGNIIPKTLGFFLCKYKVKMKKYENGEIKSFEFEGESPKKDCIQYYNPDKNGETTIVELIIEITKDL